MVTSNIVIDAFCRMGIPNKGCVLMGIKEKLGLVPYVYNFDINIYKLNRAEITNGIWNLIVMGGCLPNLATFYVRVQFLMWRANSLMGMMVS